METNEVLGLLPAVFAGIILGVLFFGGLWLTVRKGLNSKKPTLIFMGSLVIRMAIVIAGFYFVGADNWQKMLACLGGFLIARIIVTRFTKKYKQSEPVLVKEINDEN
ncbi:MAG TPA: ATP synthase subunit I [Aequorivita sp.]|nr:ATP synthase subunit I [Aequorivita sp.]